LPLRKEHYPRLYDIAVKSERFSIHNLVQFVECLKQREGYVLKRHDNIVGFITFSDYKPELDIIIHCSVLPKYQKRWLTKGILREIARYVFDYLELPRMTSYCIVGKTDVAGDFLERIGFKKEGEIRGGIKLADGRFNLSLYGLLKEECKWL
jgi:RimJ/RimL family protein N-acetyltransferase